MKIGVFTDSYKPYTSGVVTSICDFKEELTRLGHEIHIFAPSYPDYDEAEENIHRYLSIPALTNRDFNLALPIYPWMNMIVKNLELDIIHVHSPFTMGRVGMHYARKYKIPLLFTYHTRYDQYVHYIPVASDFTRDLTIKYCRNFSNKCDHVIAPSAEIADIIASYDVQTPISVIPSGVPAEKYHTGDEKWLRKHYPIPDGNRILLFVGRLSKEKNLEFLIQAFQKVQTGLSATTLVIVAYGPLEQELKDLTISLGLSLVTDVIFTGKLDFESLVHAYHSADLFVFSSLTETQGLVLIEAMAAGLPVVAVKASGVQEMVDDGINGLLTDCDTGQLADAISRVLNDDDLYSIFKTNALRKAQALSSRNMALKMEKVYYDLVARFCGNATESL